MLNFKKYLSEGLQYLEEKKIVVGKGGKYGQVIFLAGGAGSGKGFASETFMEKEKFRVRDVDEFKLAYLKLDKKKKLFPEVRDLDLKNPKDVFKLHMFVKSRGTVDSSLEYLLGDAINVDRLPNIMFDITGKNEADFSEYFPALQAVGYQPKNIHLAWVLTNYAVAVKNNAGRERVVPDDILLKTHEGAAKTVISFLKGSLPGYINGDVYVIFNNRENTLFWAKPNVANKKYTKQELKSLEGGDYSRLFTKDADGNRIPRTDSDMVPILNTRGDPVVKDFKYIQVKKSGKAMENDKQFQQDLFDLIRKDIPKTLDAWEGIQK